MIIHSLPTLKIPVKLPPCPDASIATTAVDTRTSSLRVAITSAHSWELRFGGIYLSKSSKVRLRYHFVVIGYVVMPEHIHLLISEPDRGTPSTVMQVLKQRFSRRVLSELRRKKRLLKAACGKRPSTPATSGSTASTTS